MSLWDSGGGQGPHSLHKPGPVHAVPGKPWMWQGGGRGGGAIILNSLHSIQRSRRPSPGPNTTFNRMSSEGRCWEGPAEESPTPITDEPLRLDPPAPSAHRQQADGQTDGWGSWVGWAPSRLCLQSLFQNRRTHNCTRARRHRCAAQEGVCVLAPVHQGSCPAPEKGPEAFPASEKARPCWRPRAVESRTRACGCSARHAVVRIQLREKSAVEIRAHFSRGVTSLPPGPDGLTQGLCQPATPSVGRVGERAECTTWRPQPLTPW